MDFAGEREASDNVRAAAASAPKPRKAHRSREKLCKVVGCCVDLQQLNKRYNLKKRLCPEHLKADVVQVVGCGEQLFRFCQQCGKLQDVAEFSGPRRSCRASLAKRRTLADALIEGHEEEHCQQQCRQQQQRRRRSSSGISVPVGSPAMPGSPDAAAADAVAAAAPGGMQQQPLSCTVSADEAAAALADAWCSAECSDSDYEHFPSCSALQGSPAAAAAAAAGSSDSFLSSLVQLEISRVLADCPLLRSSSSVSTCGAAARYAVAPVAAEPFHDATALLMNNYGCAVAAAAGHAAANMHGCCAAEPDEEQLEAMIEQELLAASLIANPAAAAALTPMTPYMCPTQQQHQQQLAGAHLTPASPVLLPDLTHVAPAAYGLPRSVHCFAPAAAPPVYPGSMQASARLERLRVQFGMLQQTMASLHELQAQTRQLAAEELGLWVDGADDVMQGVCYY